MSQQDDNNPSQQVMKAYEDAQKVMASYMEATTKASAAAMKGLEEMSRNMSGLMQDSYSRAVEACKTMMAAKTPQEVADKHAAFVKEYLDNMMAGSSKMSEVSMKVAKDTIDPLTQHANETVSSMMKKG